MITRKMAYFSPSVANAGERKWVTDSYQMHVNT